MVYLQVNSDGTITDCIDYQYEDYIPYDGEVPQSVFGGWFKLIDGKIIEYPELKPKDEEDLRNGICHNCMESEGE